jgi:hypothetical protein
MKKKIKTLQQTGKLNQSTRYCFFGRRHLAFFFFLSSAKLIFFTRACGCGFCAADVDSLHVEL